MFVVTELRTGRSGFDSRQKVEVFLLATESRPTLEPWVPGFLSSGVKQPGREADHSPPPSAEVKNAWSYKSAPPISIHVVVLNEAMATSSWCGT
jgi:hypothetical protein